MMNEKNTSKCKFYNNNVCIFKYFVIVLLKTTIHSVLKLSFNMDCLNKHQSFFKLIVVLIKQLL